VVDLILTVARREGLMPMFECLEIVPTDKTCVIGRRPRPGIPTLRLSTGVILEEPSAWLRFLVVKRRKSKDTAAEYAKILSEFIRLSGNRAHIALDESVYRLTFSVDDDLLIAWRDDMEVKGLTCQRINKKISCIFRWLLWCQENGYISGLVGKDPESGKVWPITAEEIESRDRNGRLSFRKETPLLLSIVRQPNRHTPTRSEIESLHGRTSPYRHAIRNSLIVSWAEEVGLRRLELLSILLEDIPSLADIEALQVSDALFFLTVRNGKGCKKRRVPVSPHLLRITYEYIKIERQDIVDRYDGCKEVPNIVFISDRGSELNPNAVSNLMGKLFKDANVRNASLHRLRAVFLTRVVESFMVKVDEHGIPIGEATVLLMAAEYAGHSNIWSLRPYLTALKRARLERRGESLAELEQRKRELKREIAMLESRRELSKSRKS
jgi:integrase